MILVKPDQSAHWYTKDGKPMYTVSKKDGTPRNTTLADARKMDLVPSVTSILGVIAKPALDAWKQEQAILSALTLPRNPDESDQDFARRVVADSKEQIGVAADLGSQVHAYVEELLAGGNPEAVKGVEASCEAVKRWIAEHVELGGMIEAPFAISGYGGRIDFVGQVDGELTVIDWKSQSVKPGKEPNYYETWELQLCAYAHAWELLAPIGETFEVKRRLSVVISTNPDNPGVWYKEWDEDRMPEFRAALTLWKWQNGFDPEKENRK